jgi:subtilisin family serine protease
MENCMKKAFGLMVACFLLSLGVSATEDVLRFRLYLTDKHGVEPTPATISLSEASLERRNRQGISLDSTDVPVYEGYVRSIEAKGLKVVSRSRWMNTVVVSVKDSSALDSLNGLNFVRESRLVWMNPMVRKSTARKRPAQPSKFLVDSVSYYGRSETQVEMLGLDALHDAGFKGKGKIIAVIDAGFLGVDTMPWFKNLKLIASRDLIYPPSNIFQGHFHGTAVLSLMATREPYQLVGTAPEASYCLLRSEDVNSEFPIEEDYWTAAAEFADSIGADVINSSLGYTEFDLTYLSYTKADLDGKTAFISKAASMASSKGMLVVSSAGNDGEKPWRKISMPSDASAVLTVGAVQSDLVRSTFSSIGPTADGRIKPDVMAMGHYVSIINGAGVLTNGYGTSFSSPLVAGMAACIWSALPALKASDLHRKILESGDRALNPDTLYGYGIPNAQRVWISSRNFVDGDRLGNFYCYPSPASDQLYLASFLATQEPVRIVIYNSFGKKVLEKNLSGSALSMDVSGLPSSIYMVEFIVSGVRQITQKIVIQR